jgi:hypothetical protein
VVETRNYERQCKGKRTYASKKNARKAIRRTVTKYGAERYSTLSVYLCPHCGWWHFGHSRRKR